MSKKNAVAASPDEPESNEQEEQQTAFDNVIKDAFASPKVPPAKDVSAPPPKTGSFGRIKVRKREELGEVLTQDIPLQLPNDFVQLYPINTEADEGVVYLINITLPNEKVVKTYVVLSEVVQEAYEQVEAGDHTFAILTPQELKLNGGTRAHELYPWMDRPGRFGLWPVKVGMEGNALSMGPYLTRVAGIRDNRGLWARWVPGSYHPLPAPPNNWAPPKWPQELLEGRLDALIHRAYRERVIKSLTSAEAKWLAGLTGI